jgi:hypothetical protein
MTSLSSRARSGLLSLSLHGAHNLKPNQSNKQTNELLPVALIRLPLCSRVYQTRSGEGTDPVWSDEFDLVVCLEQSNHPSVKQSINDYTVYDIDEEFDEMNVTTQSTSYSSNQSDEDVLLIEVIDNINDRRVIGRATLSFDQLEKHQSNNQPSDSSNNQSKMSIPLDNSAGVVELSASWTDKPASQLIDHSISQTVKSTNLSTTQQSPTDQSHGSPSYHKRGRFLISDDEEDSQSNSDKSIDKQSSNRSNNQSSDEADEISTTASTDTNLTNDQPIQPSIHQLINEQLIHSKQLPPSSLLDRRSSSHESHHPSEHPSLHPATTSVAYSFPLLEDTYTSHANRHVASFLPTLTKNGSPFWHSTGRHGLLYDDSTTFDDRNFLQSTIQSLNPSNDQHVHASVCEIRVWSRDFIHGIQITYAFASGIQVVRHFPGPKHVGRVHTTEHVLKLHHSDGEYVIGVEGTYREWVETLTIVTNRRAHTFGGNVDARHTKWKPAGSPKLPTSFRCDVPPGHRVVSFMGGYGVHLHNIGVTHVPIAERDTKRKCEGIFNTLKKKFSHTRLDTLDR